MTAPAPSEPPVADAAREDDASRHAPEAELLRRHASDPGDPQLGARYAALNRQYFAGTLPAVPVAWDERLTDVGRQVAPDIILKGMTNGHIILINPVVAPDSEEFDRVLCHEAVHVYFFQQGLRNIAHGPSFQQALARLREEGAFTGIEATPQEKAQLRAYLDSESARIETERRRITTAAAELQDQKEAFDRDVTEFNARVETANRNRTGWPSAAERATLDDRGRELKARVDAYNDDIATVNRSLDSFNDAVRRYRLMSAYPDGLDGDAAAVQTQRAVSGLAPPDRRN